MLHALFLMLCLMAIAMCIAGAFLSGWIDRVGRRSTRFPIGCCQACGYNLTGNVSGACPECGVEAPSSVEDWRQECDR